MYVGNQTGDFDAFNATTGKLVWQYTIPKTAGLSKEIEPSPAVYQNTVYFGDGNYHEYALNATTGALICTSGSVGGIISSSPLIGDPDGRGPVVYFGDAGPSGDSNVQDGGHLWAMYGVGNPDGAACSMRWMFDAFGSPAGSQTGMAGVYSSPAYYTFSNGVPVVVVGSTDNDDAIYEINASTGKAIWRFQTLTGEDADVGAPPTIAVPGTVGARDPLRTSTASSMTPARMRFSMRSISRPERRSGVSRSGPRSITATRPSPARRWSVVTSTRAMALACSP